MYILGALVFVLSCYAVIIYTLINVYGNGMLSNKPKKFFAGLAIILSVAIVSGLNTFRTEYRAVNVKPEWHLVFIHKGVVHFCIKDKVIPSENYLHILNPKNVLIENKYRTYGRWFKTSPVLVGQRPVIAEEKI